MRDLLLGRTPADWDVATNAKPEEIQRLFPKSFYTNKFGTVTVLRPALTEAPAGRQVFGRQAVADGINEVEVTTYRTEGAYRDQRHPETVKFVASIIEDLARRDFTINALAAVVQDQEVSVKNQAHMVTLGTLRVIDPFGGIKDLDAKLIRAVGKPDERFNEDALRLLRALRLAVQLGFTIEETTLQALRKHAQAIQAVSHERVRDELIKLVMSEHPEDGFTLLRQTGLLALLLPELAEGVGVKQNKHHRYTVFDHNIKSLQFAAQYGYPLHVRLAALLHDAGKPRTRRWDERQNDYTFHSHEVVGARMAEKLMRRLRFANELTAQVVHLVRHHMFYYDVGKVTEAGARRLLRRVGREQFHDLITLRIAERKGSGVPKAEPYRLRHLQFLVEKAAQAPVTVGQLAIRGDDLLRALTLRPGPAIGGILNALLAEVLDDPTKNTREYLLARAAELKDKNTAELKALGEAAKDEAEKKREEEIRRKYRV